MAPAVTCRCGVAIEPTTVGGVAYVVCPGCDRKQCRHCAHVDMTGKAVVCPRGHAISLHD